MEKILHVAITGSGGTIGTVLQQGLHGYQLTPLHHTDVDARNYTDLVKAFAGKDTVIHLAHNPNKETIRESAWTDLYDPDNSKMTYNVYKAALETKVKRVIMASSVHADNYFTWKGPEKLSVDRIPTPDTPYGANKIFMESLGRYYATKGLEVVCIRFGGVNPENKPPVNDFWENAVWLSHKDCIAMVDACLKAERVPNNFAVFYAVSNNKDRIHDTTNPFGWKPE